MKRQNINFFFFLILTSIFALSNCKQITQKTEEITQVNYIVPIWKGSLSEAPQDPEAGWSYYNTTLKKSFIYDGKSWQILSQDGMDGAGIVWKGEKSRAPSNPQINWAYYNTVDGNSYIYNGTSWDYLAKSGRDGATGILLWLGTFDTAPKNPNNGWAYYNSTDKISYIYSNSKWQTLSKDGYGIIWKGALSVPPENPEINWAFYNTTTQISYIWNGNNWDTLAVSLGGDTTVSVSVKWLGTFETAPSTPQIGDGYYNNTIGASYIFDGSIWQQISKDGIDGTNSNGGTSSTVGYLITWKGSYTTAPSNPKTGWAYYNTSSKKSYIYDGSRWQILAQDGANGTGSGSSSSNAEIKIYANNTECTYYQFGTLDYGNESPEVILNIKNTGTSTLKLTDSNIYEYMGGLYDYKDQFIIDVSNTTTSIEPGQITQFKVKYSPTKASSNISTTIYIPSNAKNGNSYFYFYGSCRAPDIYIILMVNGTQYLAYPYLNEATGNDQYSINNVDFGTTYANTPINSTSFIIQNAGANNAGTTLELTKNISITGQDASSFIITQPVSSSIAPSTTVSAQLSFKPTTTGRKTATVTIYTNAPGHEIYSFTVTGNCIASSSSSGTNPDDPNEEPESKWPKFFDGGEGDGSDKITCGVHDSEGNLYFAGYGFELISHHSGYDWWIKKFNKEGDEITQGWDKKISYYDSYSTTYCPEDIIIDSNDNVIVYSKYNIVKFFPDGDLLWEKSFTSGNIKKVYVDNLNNSYIVTTSQTIKIDNTGDEIWSISLSEKLCFDKNNKFYAFNQNSIKSYNSIDGTIISVVDCTKSAGIIESNDVYGWIESEMKSIEPVYYILPVTSGEKYWIQMNNSYNGNGTKTGWSYITMYYYYNNNKRTIIDRTDNLYKSTSFSSPITGDIIIKIEPINTNYLGTYSFRVGHYNTDNIDFSDLSRTTRNVTKGVSTSSEDFNTNTTDYYVFMLNDYNHGDGTQTGACTVTLGSIYKESTYDFWNNPYIFKPTSSSISLKLTGTKTGSVIYALTRCPATTIKEFEKRNEIEINDITIDSEDNLYVCGYVYNGFDEYSKKDVIIKKYYPNGEEDTSFNKLWDSGHSDDEYATNIEFIDSKIVVYGIGNDLLSGSSKSDKWWKTYSTEGEELTSLVLDEYETTSELIAVDENNKLYLTGARNLYVYTPTGDLERTINPSSTSPSITSEVYILNTDGYIYAGGSSYDAVTSVSSTDWGIKKF